jgi:hypothetical protein
MKTLTVQELRKLVSEAPNPEHPIAVTFLKAVSKMQDEKQVIVEDIDLQAIQQDAELLILYETAEDGSVVTRKELKQKEAPETPPT